ncbi:MAG: transcriptional regulator, GntR family with aminotransferase domain protein [Marmoricola sp.]|nr:transcriptional regulator, GntR family with aminotransferase domain protein [Marmoricola sp.]
MSTRTVAASRIAALVGDYSREPAYRGLAEGLRVLITDGRLPVGTWLPSERELTDALNVSRTTVTRAYAELREHGFLVSRQGSGSVASLPASRGLRSDHLLPPGDLPEGKIDLTCAAPVPGPGILGAYERAVAELPGYLASTGYYPSGLQVLREAVAARFEARGLRTSPEQVMIVPGAQAGVAIVARALVRRGTRTLVESPTYPNAIATLRHCGGRLLSSPVGRDDADAGDLVSSITQVRPEVGYLIPDFHNPTGHLLADEGRERVAAAFRGSGTTPIIDESIVDLALDGQTMPAPFATYFPDAITVGSLSKPFWGGLRIGWVRSPAHQVEAMFRSRLSLDLGTPLLEQLVAADLLGNDAGLLEHRRDQLRTSRDAALTALAGRLPQWAVRRPSGGLNLWCELPVARSSDLVPRAAARDVLLAPGPSFAPEGGLDRFLRIPYTQPAHVLVDAINRIAQAWDETLTDPIGLRESGPTLVA